MSNSYRTITFTIEGQTDVLVNVTEIDEKLEFQLSVLGDADLRGLFF